MTATTEQRQAFEQSRETALDSAACLIAAFRMLGVPKSMLDIGCGPGHLVRIARAFGVGAAGFDINLPAQPKVGGLVRHDLRRPIHLVRGADLTLCLEVAEHLPPDSADTLCDTLADATGETLLFSAATPGQGGSGHINERPKSYWIEMMEQRGLRVDEWLTQELRIRWSEAATMAWWYAKNVIAFRQTARRDGA